MDRWETINKTPGFSHNLHFLGSLRMFVSQMIRKSASFVWLGQVFTSTFCVHWTVPFTFRFADSSVRALALCSGTNGIV